VVASGAVHCTIAAREEMEFIELASFTEEVQAVGARVIYLYLKIQNRILLVDIYKKTDRDTLSHEQKRWLKAFALILKS
jgi:hypothetical protein